MMLLLAGQAMSAGAFTVGDFALFVYFLWFTTDLPGYLGLSRRHQAARCGD
jgi:hypothetical protein